MFSFLKQLNLFLAASILGFAFGRYAMPYLAIDLLGDHMPWRSSFAHMLMFGHYAFIRTLLIWGAAFCTALLVGWWPFRASMGVRTAVLTLPFSAPVLYGVIYLILAFKF